MKKNIVIIISGIILICCLGIIYFFLFKKTTKIVLNNDINVVLITIDTLRTDHLSCYGYEHKTSPNIDKIAAEGIRFTNTLATSSWTSPSIASIMTSLYPVSHGVRHGIIKSGKAYNQEVLNERFDSLAEILKNHGYTTFGAVANVHMTSELGFGQGFDYYYCEGFPDAYEMNNVVFSWQDKIKKSKRYFLWVHYFDPHYPYYARSPWIKEYYTTKSQIGNEDLSKIKWKELKKIISTLERKRDALEYLVPLYDSEISYVDYHIGQLISKLGLDKNSLIIITSDHGEEFLDHDSFNHGHTLYQELIHVPLIIKFPFPSIESAMSVIDEPVSIIDIMPTILGILGITPPREAQGINLLDKKENFQKLKHNYLFSELSERKTLKTIISKNWKYIFDYKMQKGELYDIVRDHKELDNVIYQEVSIAKELEKELSNWVSNTSKTPSIKKEIQLTEELEGKLKVLGYISNEEQEK